MLMEFIPLHRDISVLLNVLLSNITAFGGVFFVACINSGVIDRSDNKQFCWSATRLVILVTNMKLW